jgi:osmotically-inducible protein OsmY
MVIAGTVIILMILVSFGCASTGTATAGPKHPDIQIQQVKMTRLEKLDHSIEADILHRMALDHAVPENKIHVASRDGVVTLSGEVDSLFVKNRAENIATVVFGVREIENNITVDPAPRPDSEILADVQKRIVESEILRSNEIHPGVNMGVVILAGSVKGWPAYKLAEEAVRDIRGVREIINELAVKYDENRTDPDIKEEIEARLKLDMDINCEGIRVEVDKGLVTLSGSVPSLPEKSRTLLSAWVDGVRAVRAKELEVVLPGEAAVKTKSSGTANADKAIKDALETRLEQDPGIFSLGLKVSVDHGVVTLSGLVNDIREIDRAEKLARKTPGVKKVDNFIAVNIEETPALYGLAARVKEALNKDPLVHANDLMVEVGKGSVILAGTVDSYLEKVRAEKTVLGVQGVTAVKNDITVNYAWDKKKDKTIRRNIKDKIFWGDIADEGAIAVTVKNGVATLSGQVESWDTFYRAVDAALKGGAGHVLNKIKVKEAGKKSAELYPGGFYF